MVDASGDALDDQLDYTVDLSDEKVEESEIPSRKRKAESGPASRKKAKKTESKVPVGQRAIREQLEEIERCHKKSKPHLSGFELEELSLHSDDMVDAQLFKNERTLDHLASFVKFATKNYKAKLLKAPNEETPKGSPLVLIMTGSAIRATDIIRALEELKRSGKIAKLFAKHLKVAQQIGYLKSNVVNIGVGTASRLSKLIAEDALKLDRLETLILDCVPDKKNLHLFQLENGTDIFELLDTHIVPAARARKEDQEAERLRVALF
ncbi:hypothetical protein BZG36_02607 [Bifiguratus adelaidae]|uniref:Protein CMS1 n=1 Tax=Bifiguratus adelaidae TaxID=1938954 RepID=A0A261Y2Q0_9FUNG|nr:hypothetical protein BZG36_02607 [Bifiguratus adelaidae]